MRGHDDSKRKHVEKRVRSLAGEINCGYDHGYLAAAIVHAHGGMLPLDAIRVDAVQKRKGIPSVATGKKNANVRKSLLLVKK